MFQSDLWTQQKAHPDSLSGFSKPASASSALSTGLLFGDSCGSMNGSGFCLSADL
jgi:hypothetical protein